MQMRIARNDAIHRREELTHDSLADRFPTLKSSILTHVTKIWCDKEEACGAVSSQGFRGEEDREEFVIWLVERGIDDGRWRRLSDRHTHLSVWKPVYRNFMERHITRSGKPLGFVERRRQRLHT